MPQLYIQVLHFGLRKLANSTAWKNLKQYGTSLISGLFLKYPPKKKKKKVSLFVFHSCVYEQHYWGGFTLKMYFLAGTFILPFAVYSFQIAFYLFLVV